MRRREAVVVVGGVLLLLAAAFALSYWAVYARSPEAVVKRFIEADRDGRSGEEAGLVRDTPGSHLILGLLQGVRQQTGASVFERAHVVRTSVNDESAAVDVEAYLPAIAVPGQPPGPGGPPASSVVVTFYLAREKGSWRIDPVQTVGSLAGIMAARGLQGVLTTLFPQGLPAGFPPLAGIPPAPRAWPGTAPSAPPPTPPPTGARR